MNARIVRNMAIVGAVSAAMGPEWKTGKTKPGTLIGVPAYDYVDSSRYSRIDTVPCLTGSLIESAVDANGQALALGVRGFTLSKPAMEVDHCRISRVSVALLNDGGYTVSLRGEQNASFEVQSQQGAGGNVVSKLGAVRRSEAPNHLLNTGHLRRNEFDVRVRFYAAPSLSNGSADSRVPGPVLMTLDLKPFMVQRGETAEYFLAGNDPAVQRFFRLVERAEIDFRYK